MAIREQGPKGLPANINEHALEVLAKITDQIIKAPTVTEYKCTVLGNHASHIMETASFTSGELQFTLILTRPIEPTNQLESGG